VLLLAKYSLAEQDRPAVLQLIPEETQLLDEASEPPAQDYPTVSPDSPSAPAASKGEILSAGPGVRGNRHARR
jgi:hypothetical protein